MSGFPWGPVIAFIAVIVAVIAIIITNRFQILSFVNAQLIEIAKTCNSYLQEDYQVHKDGKITQGRASGIVTALEDAEKIINQYYVKSRLVFKSDKDDFKRFFYNHLHSSIKVILKQFLKEEKPGFTYQKEGKYDPIRKDQLEKACNFFKKEINETWEFEKNREKRLGIQ